jgi:hypothetical protein
MTFEMEVTLGMTHEVDMPLEMRMTLEREEFSDDK